LRPEYAAGLAEQQALSGQPTPRFQQMTPDVVGEQAAQAAEAQENNLRDAGFAARVGAGALSQIRGSELGLAEAAADLFGDKSGSASLRGQSRVEAAKEKAIPKSDNIALQSLQYAMTSLAGQAPFMVMSAVTGTPLPVLAQAAVQQFGQSYAEGKQAGLEPSVAALRAVPMAAAEVFFERFGMTKALSGLKDFVAHNGLESIPAYMAKAIATEIPSELATTTTQYMVDALPGLGINKNPNLMDLYKQLEETLRQTILQSGVTAGVTTGGAKAYQAARELPYRTPEAQLGRALEQDISARDFNPDRAKQVAAQSLSPDNAQVGANPPVKMVGNVTVGDTNFSVPPTGAPGITPPTVSKESIDNSGGLFRRAVNPLQNPDPQRLDPTYDAEGKFTGWKNKEVTQSAGNGSKAAQPAAVNASPITPATKEETPDLIQADDFEPTDLSVTPVTLETPKEEKTDTGLDLPIVYPLVGSLKVSKDVPQFKAGANEKGVVEPLGGTFEGTGVAPIQVWRRLNGDLEVISGRHRLDLAQRSGKVTIPAQIHNEADGFDKRSASILDAELNIRDGQGKVKDYVDYFQGSQIDRQEAESRGLLARAIGKRSYAIATDGSQTLITALRGDVVSDEAAYLIAKNYPNNEKLQSVAVKAIQEGKTIAAAVNLMHAVNVLSEEGNTTVDLFGQDDSGMREAEDMQKIASKKQREVAQRLSAITGASKNPALAKAEGIDIKDPAAVKARIDELRQMKSAWEQWPTSPELIAEIRGELSKPLELKGETEAEIRSKEAKAKEASDKASREATKADEARKAEEERKEIARRSENTEFSLTPTDEVDKEKQAAIDKKAAEDALAGQGDIFGEENVSPEYKLALEKSTLAYQEFKKAQLAFRAQEINDEEFLAARKRFDDAGAEYDKALEKEQKRGAKSKPEEKKEELPYTPEQRSNAQDSADDVGGEIVWQRGDYALVRGYSALTGDAIFIPVMGTQRARVDISVFTGKQISPELKQEMIAAKEKIEAEAEEKHKKAPFITFDTDVVLSNGVPKEIGSVIKGWKALLGLVPNIYVSTIDDAKENRNNFTGPHRRIGSGTLSNSEIGSMRRMADGSYYILFTKSTSVTKMLEAISHELGHLHEKEVFNNATPEEKVALRKAHEEFLGQQKGKTKTEFVQALRARTVGRGSQKSDKEADSDFLRGYWGSFSEWYADQTSRWAMSSKKPQTIVEKYFSKLGAALRRFFETIKGQKYLPSETFVKYMEAVNKRPLLLGTDEIDQSSSMQGGFDFNEESDLTDKIAAADPVSSEALHKADQPPTASKKLIAGRSPELTAAAALVKAGQMTAAEYDKLVNKYKPIYVYTAPLVPATMGQMVEFLASNKRDKINPSIPEGTAVGLRLDIPAYKNGKGAYVVTIHSPGTKSGAGTALGYASVASVVNATFGLGNQKATLNIAAGEAKDALQTIEGAYRKITPEQATERMKAALTNPAWTQIGTDPTRHSYFYDRRTTVPVIAAEEILQIGNMVMGKNVTYGDKDTFLYNINPIEKNPETTAKERRAERIEEYAQLRRRSAEVQKQMRNTGSTLDTQRLSNELYSAAQGLKEAIDYTAKPVVTPENFLNQARRAVDGDAPFKGQVLSPEVFAVIQAAYQKTPWLLDGLRLSIKTPKQAGISTGSFGPYTRITTLWAGTSGTEDPRTVRHEFAHSMEQMMTPAQRGLVIDAWAQDLGKKIKNSTDQREQDYFVAVLNFLNNPNETTHKAATDALPSYDHYQYLNPSEYWAVNAEPLLNRQLGGTWDKFKKALARLFEGLKSILGFNNKYAVHKVFQDIVSGDRKRMSKTMLIDVVTASGYSTKFLNNIQDEERLIAKYNRPNTPMLNTTPVRTAILNGAGAAKNVFKATVKDPMGAVGYLFTGADRALLHARNREIFFGSGLNAADFSRYKGELRVAGGLATASVALDNALRGWTMASQVILNGGIEYNQQHLNFTAVKKPKGMAGVYKAEMTLKKRLGNQLGTDIVQGYLEAKRSLSILNEVEARQDQVDDLLDELTNMPPGTKAAVVEAKRADYEEAVADLKSIQLVERKVSMSAQEIEDFIDMENNHPELLDIMENWTAVNQNMLRFWRQVGLISQSRYDLLSGIKDYVPWNRIMEGEATAGGFVSESPLLSSTKSMTNIGKEKVFKAGKPTVQTEFVAKAGQDTFQINPSTVIGATINDVAVNPSDIVSSPNGEVKITATIVEGDTVRFKANREIENMIDNMTRSVMRMTMNGLRQYSSMRTVSEYATRNDKNKIRVFPKVDRKEGTFNFIANGRNIIVQIKDPLIADAVYGLDTIDVAMFQPLIATANLLRRAITLSGVFQIKQVFKDAPTAALVTGVKRPDLLIGGVYKGFVTSLLRPMINAVGSKMVGRNLDIEPVVELLRAAGIGGFHSPSRTPEAAVKLQLGMMNRNVVSFVLKALDHIGDSSDMAQRVAVYKRVLKETGDEAQALYQAANVINFLHRGYGAEAQFLAKTVPFMGAWANASDVLVQSLAGGGLKGMSRSKAISRLAITGSLLMGSTLLYCMLVGADEDYEELDDITKMRNYVIPGTKIYLPMNTQAGFLFKGTAEILYNHFIRSSTATPHDATRLKTALKEAAMDMLLGPEPLPPVVKTFAEIAFKHDFFTSRPVVPTGLENLYAVEQYTAATSEAGKILSGFLPGDEKSRLLNPIEADHVIKGLFGTAGAMAMWLSNQIGEAASMRPATPSNQVPIIGAFTLPAVGRKNEDLFYDLKERVDKEYKTFETRIDRLKVGDIEKYTAKQYGLIALHDYIQDSTKEMAEIDKVIRFVGSEVDTGETPKEKRKTIENLQRAKSKILSGVELFRGAAGL